MCLGKSVFSRLLISVFLFMCSGLCMAAGVRFPNPSFLQNFYPLRTLPFYGLPDSTAELGPYKVYKLLRDPEWGWLLIGNGTGQVWKLNADLVWERQDSTQCIGYNFGAMILPGPMKFGGHGIWRTNGFLIRYLKRSYEWETIALNREIPNQYSDNCYYDRRDSCIYLLGSFFSNVAIKEYNAETDSIYRLDIATGDWQVLGVATKELHEHTGRSLSLHSSYTMPNGILFLSSQLRKMVALDFTTGMATVIGDDISVRIWEMGETNYSHGKVVVSDSVALYSMNPETYELLDTLTWKEVLSHKESTFAFYTPVEEDSVAKYRIPVILVVLLGTGLSLLLVSRRKKKQVPAEERGDAIAPAAPSQNTKETTPPPSQEFRILLESEEFMLNGVILSEFTTKEKQLLRRLIDLRFRQEALSTQDFNEILGIDQRTLDTQKKIRSEVIRNINRRFNEAGFPGEAIERSRLEDDRRSVAYELSATLWIDSPIV